MPSKQREEREETQLGGIHSFSSSTQTPSGHLKNNLNLEENNIKGVQ